jgi:PAS domain S-box-containing protein
MNVEVIFLNSIIILALALISFFLIRTLMKFFRDKKRLEQKDLSKVGFVVDTFHELVSKLKDKEKELEELRKNAEDRATAIEGYNENILQSVPSGVISFDENMRITKVNQAAEKILEIKREIVVGKYHNEVLNKPVTDLLNEKKLIERGETGYITPSGKRIWLGLTLSPLKESEGRAIGQILIFTDLTHLKAFEAQLALRDKLSTLGELSAGIAHELRNPMGVIAGYTKLLSKKVDNSLKSTVDAVSKEIRVMDRIISDFLSFAKVTELNVSEINIKKILGNCLSSVVGERDDIKLNLNIDELPPVRGDEVLLRQAFTNLLQNSIEAMPKGGELTINASTLSDHEGQFLKISISDTGHGISENIIDKIFLPFFTTKEKGTGLGLAIVHKIVVSHGGRISADSSEKGTAFNIRLPLG